ncbi:hypothetical protein V6N13_017616 [Hibiscus sabdariffa]|uniref:Uncharacterized protein n=2 Tax=Hibiscus sabdariffa TaxID=183260 RepID=A0ABR1ZV51_9ROSI
MTLLILDIVSFVLDILSKSTKVPSTASTTLAAVVFALSVQEFKRKKREGLDNEEIMQMIVSFALLLYGFIQMLTDFIIPCDFIPPPSLMPLISSILLCVLHFLRPPPTHIMCQGQVCKLATLPQRREFEPEEYIYIKVLDCGCQTQVYERLPQDSPRIVGQTPQSSTVYESLPQDSPGTVGQTSQTIAEAVIKALERGGSHAPRKIERSCSLPISLPIELDTF